MSMKLYDMLAEHFPSERLMANEPMRAHTTFRVGGNADIFFLPKDVQEVQTALLLAKKANCPVTFIGRGSNLLVRDGGIRALTVCFGEAFGGIRVEGNMIIAGAGETLTHVSNVALENGLSGLEFASGIPGSVGGGMAMNAGAYGGELSSVTKWAYLMDSETGEVRQYDVAHLQMGYRTSLALKENKIVTGAAFCLTPGNKEDIKSKMDDFNRRRREKQPLNYPSAGSTFKRPEGHFAGALIEQAGLKGTRVGGAEVSELHAGFIINRGDATARDILDLIALVTKRVYEHAGITLKPEVRIIGEEVMV